MSSFWKQGLARPIGTNRNRLPQLQRIKIEAKPRIMARVVFHPKWQTGRHTQEDCEVDFSEPATGLICRSCWSEGASVAQEPVMESGAASAPVTVFDSVPDPCKPRGATGSHDDQPDIGPLFAR